MTYGPARRAFAGPPSAGKPAPTSPRARRRRGLGRAPPPMHLTLLGRAYCHLCDEMLDALRPLAARHGATVTVVDVDAEPALEQAFGARVPVLFAGDPASGAELCHFRLDRAGVEAALTEAQAAGN